MNSNPLNPPSSPRRVLILGAFVLLLAAAAALSAGWPRQDNAPPSDPFFASHVLTPTLTTAFAAPTPEPTLTAVLTATRAPGLTPFPTQTVTPALALRAYLAYPTSLGEATPLPVSTYIVQAGETLTAIAFRLGLGLTNLAGYNRIDDPSLILAGQVLQIPPHGYTSPPLPSPSGAKQVVVSLKQQRVFAYQGSRQIYNFLVSTGKDNSTWTGSFTILDKLPYPYSPSWGFNMPYWLGIYFNPDNGNVENGFHALPITPAGKELWGDALGTPVSYGCIVLAPYDAKILYDWVEIGTPVLIYP